MKTKSNSKIPIRDLCQTPPYALEPLYPYMKEGITIWEPACGEGILVEELLKRGYKVKWSDILRDVNEDFFTMRPKKYDLLLTNPPYSIKYEWLTRCYELSHPFALLMPVDILGSKTAQRLFEQFGVEVILMDKRINFKMPNKGWDGGGADFSSAWFTWGMCIGRTLSFFHMEDIDGPK